MKKLAIIGLTVLVSYFTASAQIAADIVITNANIHTIDAERSTARSIAMLNGRIVAVGSEADTKSLIGPGTRVVDAKGKLVMPGFNDAHVHFTSSGMGLSSIDLRTSASQVEFAQRIRDYAAKLKAGEWILGGRWDQENWKPNDLPTRQLIDAVAPNNPVFVQRLDGHMAVANSIALKLA